MSRDAQRYRKTYSYYRVPPRVDTLQIIVDESLDWKASVRAASTTNVPLSGATPVIIDGVSLVDEDRVLLKNQSTSSQNGIYYYEVTGGNYQFTRASDARQGTLSCGAATYIEEGTTNKKTVWILTTTGEITVDTTSPLTWEQFLGGGGGGGSGDSYWFSTTAKAIYTTGSVAIRGEDTSIDAAEDIGSDVFFYVSGSISGSTGYDKKSVFGGDVKVSGSFSQGYLTFASGTYSHAEGNETHANGIYSHAEGEGSYATGASSHAEGFGTSATGDWSHAEGQQTVASGERSHAEGSLSEAAGLSSHAEGNETHAIGGNSHSEGELTYAYGSTSHAEGLETKAYGYGSHAEGDHSTSVGDYSHAEGHSSITSGSYSHAEGYGAITSGSYSHAEGVFSIAIGQASHAEGASTYAWGEVSHTEGFGTIASGSYSHAEGFGAKTIGEFSHAEGAGAIASGSHSHAEGLETITSGSYSHAEGEGTIAVAQGAHAEGYYTIAIGSYSHAEGYYTAAGCYGYRATVSSGLIELYVDYGDVSSQFSVGGYVLIDDPLYYAYESGNFLISNVSFNAISGRTEITLEDSTVSSLYDVFVAIRGTTSPAGADVMMGDSSHAEGKTSKTQAKYSHAEGNNTLTSGLYSHAEGVETKAYGSGSHAEGWGSIARGQFSHAEGYGTETSGSYSHAEGYYTIASGSHQHVGGKFNKRGNDFSLFVIGDGTGDADANRSDIVRVNSGSIGGAGSVQITGSLYVSGTSTFDSMGRAVNDIGTDVFFFVSGSITGSGDSDKKAVFGGDVVVSGSLSVHEFTEFFGDTMTLSGSLFASGNLYIDGNVYANVITASHGFSGSLTCLSDGTPYLVAGPNITINTASNGSVEISSSFSSSDSYWLSTVSDAIYTTGSVVIRGNDTGVYAAADKGADVFFYVSGSITGSGTADKKAVFGGDVVVSGSLSVHEFTELFGDAMILSGSLFASGNMYVDGNIYSSGIITSSQGFSGSLTRLSDGTPYLIAGPNITINTASNGSVEISSSYYTSPAYWTSPSADNILTTGSVTIAGDLTVNGDMTTVNTVNLEVKDAIIGLGFSSGTVALSADDRGIIGGIAGGDNVTLIWKNSEGEFAFGRTAASPKTAPPVPLTSYANLHAANIQGSIITASIGFSGSLTKLTDNTDYLIAGTNINLTTGSKGQITINNVAPTFYQWNELSPTPELNTTASVILAGGQGSSYSTSNVGTDVFFFASGSVGSRGGSIKGVAAFGGDVVITGSIAISGSAELSGDITEISGSLLVSGTTDINGDLYANNIYSSGIITASIGFSGSLTKLKDGTDYLIAGTNINLVTGSKGQVTINNVAPLFYQWNELSPSPALNTTASVAIAGGLGSSYAASDNGTDVFFFVSGSISGSSPNDKKSVFGGDVRISGSLAQGFFPDASGKQSHAQGVLTKASGLYSHAEGYQSITTGETSHAEGFQSTAAGDYSHAEGQYSSANGVSSHAEGNHTTATGVAAHAEGDHTTAYGYYSHAEGSYTTADGYYSHAEGQRTYTEINADYSHAEGYYTITSGTHSHVEGYYAKTTFGGQYSHAEGAYTTGSALYSHAEGERTITVGRSSHAEGYYTIASGTYQHVGGKYNKRGNDFSLFVIGDGTGDSDANRSDIVRVNSGSTGGTGRFEVTGTLAATQGLSGSLTQLVDGTSYLIAGNNTTITSASNGPVTISAIPTSPANSVQFNDAGAFGGSSNFNFYNSSNTLAITGTLGMKGDVVPDTDYTYNLGASGLRWANVYTGDLHLKNDRGDWTIVEEKDYLCVVNNITGKKYKMMLQEIKDES